MPYARTFPRRRRAWGRRYSRRNGRNFRRRSRSRDLVILAGIAIVLILIALANSH